MTAMLGFAGSGHGRIFGHKALAAFLLSFVLLLPVESSALAKCPPQGPQGPIKPMAPATTPVLSTHTAPALCMAIILPGTCDDWSWNQAMCEAVVNFAPLSDGRTFSVAIKEMLPDLTQAEAQVRAFIADGVPIILTHGTQYLPLVRKLAPEFPNTLFVYGSSDKTPFPNVVAYDTQPQEGAYLMGMAAGLMTRTNMISVIAPVDVNDAVAHARGFEEGVMATNPQATISVTYTGTFQNSRLTANLAMRSLQAGADILTGSSKQSYGALQEVMNAPGALWAGTAYDMTPLAPQSVMAVQMYDFRNMLTRLLEAHSKGSQGNFVLPMSLSRGSMRMQWNDMVPPAIRALVDKRQQEIVDGTFTPDIKTLRYHSFAGY